MSNSNKRKSDISYLVCMGEAWMPFISEQRWWNTVFAEERKGDVLHYNLWSTSSHSACCIYCKFLPSEEGILICSSTVVTRGYSFPPEKYPVPFAVSAIPPAHPKKGDSCKSVIYDCFIYLILLVTMKGVNTNSGDSCMHVKTTGFLSTALSIKWWRAVVI